MYAAVDPATSRMVDREYTWLMSPPIDVTGVGVVIGQWDMWVDLPDGTHDLYNLNLAANDNVECVSDLAAFVDEQPGWWTGVGPEWNTWTDDWSNFAGRDWLSILWVVYNTEPPEPGAEHMAGIFLNRQRVGIPIGEAGAPWWSYAREDRFRDTFDLSDALEDEARLVVHLLGRTEAVTLVASNDAGTTWSAYPMTYDSGDWVAGSPDDLIDVGEEIWYYFEAVDCVGQTALLPTTAPSDCFEFSILPIHGSAEDPGILLVDKHGEKTPSDYRAYTHTSEFYYREALDILGYEYDVYDVPVPGAEGSLGNGANHPTAHEVYDTHIWFTGNLTSSTLTSSDQYYLISAFGSSTPAAPFRLFLVGNEIGYDLVAQGHGVGGFFENWLGASYEGRHPGVCPHFGSVDTLIQIADIGLELMRYDDRICWLRCGAPETECFDVIDAVPASGSQRALEFKNGTNKYAAGVVKVDSTSGYRIVYLPFGIEFMNEGLNGVSGHYLSGVDNRVDLVANVMQFFDKPPSGPGTGTPSTPALGEWLACARPNPFNPATTIEYSVGDAAHVTVRIHDLTGRVVKTLVDRESERGQYRTTWDGTTYSGERAASGVYFVVMAVDGGAREMRKVVLLK